MRFSTSIFVLAAIAVGCTSHDRPKEIAFTPPPVVSPTPCAFLAKMYPASLSSFTAHKVTMDERKVIDQWAATVPAAKQKYVRWMRLDSDVIVFVANPDFEAPPRKPGYGYIRNPRGGPDIRVPLAQGGGYYPWVALNTTMIIDPVQCEIHAAPGA